MMNVVTPRKLERNYHAEVLCDGGEVMDVFFEACDNDDLVACALQEASDRQLRPVSVEALWKRS